MSVVVYVYWSFVFDLFWNNYTHCPAIGGGEMWVYSIRRVIASWLEFFPEKSGWCRNERFCQGGKVCKAVQSKGLDIALYKNIPF